jgi:hypothetical protein
VAGDADNTRLWADADVYVSFDLEAESPVDETTEFGADWELIGLLDGEQGFVETREEEETDHYAWGGILFKTGRRNFKLTRTFTAFEDNETTRRLRWPGSEGDEIRVPRPERVLIEFETREGDLVRRVISAYQAEVKINGDVTENEVDPAALPFVATIFPDTSVTPARLFHVQPTDDVSTGS